MFGFDELGTTLLGHCLFSTRLREVPLVRVCRDKHVNNFVHRSVGYKGLAERIIVFRSEFNMVYIS